MNAIKDTNVLWWCIKDLQNTTATVVYASPTRRQVAMVVYGRPTRNQSALIVVVYDRPTSYKVDVIAVYARPTRH